VGRVSLVARPFYLPKTHPQQQYFPIYHRQAFFATSNKAPPELTDDPEISDEEEEDENDKESPSDD